MNDIQNVCSQDCQLIQYADDTVIYASHKSLSEAKKLVEKEASILSKYFDTNYLSLNTEKTELPIYHAEEIMTSFGYIPCSCLALANLSFVSNTSIFT